MKKKQGTVEISDNKLLLDECLLAGTIAFSKQGYKDVYLPVTLMFIQEFVKMKTKQKNNNKQTNKQTCFAQQVEEIKSRN